MQEGTILKGMFNNIYLVCTVLFNQSENFLNRSDIIISISQEPATCFVVKTSWGLMY
jgi:hypothetical protein